jgi:hypothetical protein
MPEAPRSRSALQFVVDVTGGYDVVYRVVVYLQDLVRQLEDAAGLRSRARIDLILLSTQQAQLVLPERLLSMATQSASQSSPSGASLRPLVEQLKQLPYEGGGFHTFLLLTRNLAHGWESDVPTLQQMVGSVTGLCCGAACAPETAVKLSKEPGGTRIVNPLDTIRIQFDSIANWLIENFADKRDITLGDPSIDIHNAPTVRYADLGRPTRPRDRQFVTDRQSGTDRQPDPPPPVPGAKWRVLEPADRSDATEHLRAAHITGATGWKMIGASRRGKLHAHEGTYRDDEFAFGMRDDWNLIAVADGAGSHKLSRVGARVSTEAAITAMRASLANFGQGETPDYVADLRGAIRAGFKAAHQRVNEEAQQRGIPVRDLSATLLLAAHGPVLRYTSSIPTFLATGQIGDGMILMVGQDHSLHLIGEANKGYYSGETIFLPGTTPNDWENHTLVQQIEQPLMILVMTDGVADDLVPYQRQAPTLVKAIENVFGERQPDLALLETIGYEKRDSADDRTLVVLYRFTGGVN